MSQPDYEQIERQTDVPRSGVHPNEDQGEPGVTPEADVRPTFEGGEPSYKGARAVPDEPLKPQD
jgi:hypothetical protein